MGNVSGSVIQVDESKIRGHVDEVVRSSVEATLNGLLDAEADQLCRAERYERTPDRVDTRAGSYERKLQTKAGEATLKIPRLRSLPFETQIIERYRRRESSVWKKRWSHLRATNPHPWRQGGYSEKTANKGVNALTTRKHSVLESVAQLL